MNGSFALRPARPEDAQKIADLLHGYATEGVLLDRSAEDILFYLKNFTVAIDPAGELLGCMAVRDFGNDLLEVRSLAIKPELKRIGIGRQWVSAAIDRLRQERVSFRLFALTLQPGFFERLGFVVVEKELFPEKIWHDCVNCPKQHCCDEIAVIFEHTPAAE